MKYIYMFFFLIVKVQGQSLPVEIGTLEEYYRREQLLGEVGQTVSFSLRPLFPVASFDVDNVFDPDNKLKINNYWHANKLNINGRGGLQFLPLSLKQQINSYHPYGWSDGAMVPARGYQAMVSGGFFIKFGLLSLQLWPELVYAQNKTFNGFGLDRNSVELQSYYYFQTTIDSPEQFGVGAYRKANWGQSSIRLTLGAVSFGLSNENVWWGPGKRNSIVMTNNAAGFKHLTLNTVKPIKTFIGSFEAQIIAGKLESSGIDPLVTNNAGFDWGSFFQYNPEWRYLTGFTINYQPKWIPGLFLGFTRDFICYNNDLRRFGDYFPFLVPFQKASIKTDGDPFDRDQRFSLSARWLFTKAHAEVYFEYGLNDNAYNYRDFVGSPDHARAYVFGISKLIPFGGKKDEFIQVNGEITQMSQSADRIIRPAGGFYQHSKVNQGYTNLGQVLGAGIGTGGNLQSFDVNWVKGLKKIGVAFERYEHNADFYNESIGDLNGNSRRWVDFALAAQGEWKYKNLLFNMKLQGIKSLNYQWRMKNYTADKYYVPHNDVFNFHAELGTVFVF